MFKSKLILVMNKNSNDSTSPSSSTTFLVDKSRKLKSIFNNPVLALMKKNLTELSSPKSSSSNHLKLKQQQPVHSSTYNLESNNKNKKTVRLNFEKQSEEIRQKLCVTARDSNKSLFKAKYSFQSSSIFVNKDDLVIVIEKLGPSDLNSNWLVDNGGKF